MTVLEKLETAALSGGLIVLGAYVLCAMAYSLPATVAWLARWWP